ARGRRRAGLARRRGRARPSPRPGAARGAGAPRAPAGDRRVRGGGGLPDARPDRHPPLPVGVRAAGPGAGGRRHRGAGGAARVGRDRHRDRRRDPPGRPGPGARRRDPSLRRAARVAGPGPAGGPRRAARPAPDRSLVTAGAPRPLRPIRAPRAGGPAARRGAPVRAAALALAVAAVLAGAGLAGAIQEVPFLAGRVTDQAGLVPAATRERLERKLAELEKRTGAQVAVLTVATLDGEPIEDFAVRVFQSWKLGRRGVDDGVLFVVARQERRMRIEVGYGLESRLTDAVSREILDDRVRPRFRTGDFGGGIEAGVDAIVAVVQGAPLPAAPARAPERAPLPARLLFGALFTVVIGTFSVVALVTPGVVGWFLYLFLTPFYATFPAVIFPPRGG